MAISITITPNTLKYVKKTLNLIILICLYQRPLNRPNNTYTIAPITSSDFEDPNFLILLKISGINNIKKTMIFIDSVEKGIVLGIHFQTFLLNNLKDRRNDIIKSFSLVLKEKTKTDWLEVFLNDNTRIIIYTNAVRVRINILDIKRVLQWTIVDYFTLATVF